MAVFRTADDYMSMGEVVEAIADLHDEVDLEPVGGELKVFRGTVTMTSDGGGPAVHPTMTHFFYMDEHDPTKVKRWYGAVGPVAFG